MGRVVLADASFLIALLSARDENHEWSVAAAERHPPPWRTCESVLSECFHLLGLRGAPALRELLRRRVVLSPWRLEPDLERVLELLEKYSNVPMSLADACLVRLTETSADPVLLTTDADFRVYRRLGRQAIPCETP